MNNLKVSYKNHFNLSPELWYQFVRSNEFEMIVSLLPSNIDTALEVGAGDGFQSKLLAPYCNHLICTEYSEKYFKWQREKFNERTINNIEYMRCDAQDLSRFKNNSFDFIYSSNALEHIPDINKCLREFHRVLKNNGVMIHLMPNRAFKLAYFLMAPFNFKIPRIHGVSSNHLSELYAFGKKAWIKRFIRNNFVIKDIINMPFYIGHGTSLLWLTILGNELNLPASFAYIIKKST